MLASERFKIGMVKEVIASFAHYCVEFSYIVINLSIIVLIIHPTEFIFQKLLPFGHYDRINKIAILLTGTAKHSLRTTNQ